MNENKPFNEIEGWGDIINEMCEELRPYNIVITDIREKWGELRVRYSFDGPDEEKKKIDVIIDRAIDRCDVTCQYCGKPAVSESINGWIWTLCPECKEKKRRGIF
jgi:hypothetical protein